MAIGDITEIELQATLTTTNTDTSLANPDSDHVTHIQSIIFTLQSGSASARKITMYKNGTAASNEVANLDIDPSDPTVLIADPRFKLTGTQTMYLKQASGNDVNVLVTATRERVS